MRAAIRARFSSDLQREESISEFIDAGAGHRARHG